MPVLQTRTGTAVPRQENGRFTRSTPESTASGNPFSPDLASATRGANLYGFCSIEDFPAPITDLSYTHEDAQGFHDYVKQFAAPNFWYRDAGVLSWIYGEEYDNWQNTYGFDACLVEYHSGHGGMAANGVFSMPMGGSWGGTAWANSSSMRLGNEAARYLFFSTCESLRVHGGHSPLRTWGPANLGVRMIFGFETVSVDNPDYGRNFWQKWNQNNRSFSKAWLDASSADQRAPGPLGGRLRRQPGGGPGPGGQRADVLLRGGVHGVVVVDLVRRRARGRPAHHGGAHGPGRPAPGAGREHRAPRA